MLTSHERLYGWRARARAEEERMYFPSFTVYFKKIITKELPVASPPKWNAADSSFEH
jgi:hypothetical protein